MEGASANVCSTLRSAGGKTTMTDTVTSPETYECNACGETFDSKSAMRRHLYQNGLVY